MGEGWGERGGLFLGGVKGGGGRGGGWRSKEKMNVVRLGGVM